MQFFLIVYVDYNFVSIFFVASVNLLLTQSYVCLMCSLQFFSIFERFLPRSRKSFFLSNQVFIPRSVYIDSLSVSIDIG